MPPQIAAQFTLGEVAALAVIARQVQQGGTCSLPIDAIAALAGVSRTTTQNALRQAKTIGFLHVRERRRKGQPNLPNIVTVAAPEWRTWLKIGEARVGFKNSSATNNRFIYSAENSFAPVDIDDKNKSLASQSGVSCRVRDTFGFLKRKSDSASCKSTSKQVLSA